jgi:hypothetical protein
VTQLLLLLVESINSSDPDQRPIIRQAWRRALIETLRERGLSEAEVPVPSTREGIVTERYRPFWNGQSTEALETIRPFLNVTDDERKHPGRPRLARTHQVLQMFNEGASQADIAAQFGISRQAVNQIVRRG